MNADTSPLLQQADEAMRRNDAERLADIADQLIAEGTAVSLAKGLYFRGVSERMRGRLAEALVTLDEATVAIRNAGDHFALGDVEMSIGLIHWMMGDLSRALAHIEHALDVQRSHTPDRNEAAILGNIGLVYKDMGDFRESIRWFHMAIDDARKFDLPNAEAVAHLNIGMIYGDLGDHASSIESLLTAREMFVKTKNERALLHADLHHAIALSELGESERSLQILSDVLVRAREIGDRQSIPQVLHALATSAHRLNDLDAADRYLAEIDEYRPLPGTLDVSTGLLRAQSAQKRGDHATARTILLDALNLAESSQLRTLQIHLHQALVRSVKELSMFEEYVRHSEEAAALEKDVRGADVQRALTLERHREETELRRREIERHRQILYSTLPPHIADRVLRGEHINDTFDNAAVIFIDIVGFTSMSASMSSEELLHLLSQIFTACDAIVAKHHVLKIKTIGDSYMAVALPMESDGSEQRVASPAERAAHTAFDILSIFSPAVSPAGSPSGPLQVSFRSPAGSPVRVRIGIHSGPVTAGVIGTERLQYDVWGDTVNVASRMESTGQPGRIQVSESFASSLAPDTWHVAPGTWHLTPRGEIDVKGKGHMKTFWLDRG